MSESGGNGKGESKDKGASECISDCVPYYRVPREKRANGKPDTVREVRRARADFLLFWHQLVEHPVTFPLGMAFAPLAWVAKVSKEVEKVAR